MYVCKSECRSLPEFESSQTSSFPDDLATNFPWDDFYALSLARFVANPASFPELMDIEVYSKQSTSIFSWKIPEDDNKASHFCCLISEFSFGWNNPAWKILRTFSLQELSASYERWNVLAGGHKLSEEPNFVAAWEGVGSDGLGISGLKWGTQTSYYH